MDIGIGIYVFVLVVCGLIALSLSVVSGLMLLREQERRHKLIDQENEEILRLKRKDEQAKGIIFSILKENITNNENIDELYLKCENSFKVYTKEEKYLPQLVGVDVDKYEKSAINGLYISIFCSALMVLFVLLSLNDFSKSNYKTVLDKLVEAEVQKKLSEVKKPEATANSKK